MSILPYDGGDESEIDELDGDSDPHGDPSEVKSALWHRL